MKPYLFVITGLFSLACTHTSTLPSKPATDMGPKISNTSYTQEGNAAFDACYAATKDNPDIHLLYFCTCIEMTIIANTKSVVDKYHLVYEADIFPYIREMMITPDQKNACMQGSSRL